MECRQEEKVIDACKKFTSQIDIDLETKKIYFNEEKIKLDSNETFFEAISNFPEDYKKYKIILYDNEPNVIVNIKGKKIISRAKKGDTYKSILERMKINFKNLFFWRKELQ